MYRSAPQTVSYSGAVTMFGTNYSMAPKQKTGWLKTGWFVCVRVGGGGGFPKGILTQMFLLSVHPRALWKSGVWRRISKGNFDTDVSAFSSSQSALKKRGVEEDFHREFWRRCFCFQFIPERFEKAGCGGGFPKGILTLMFLLSVHPRALWKSGVWRRISTGNFDADVSAFSSSQSALKKQGVEEDFQREFWHRCFCFQFIPERFEKAGCGGGFPKGILTQMFLLSVHPRALWKSGVWRRISKGNFDADFLLAGVHPRALWKSSICWQGPLPVCAIFGWSKVQTRFIFLPHGTSTHYKIFTATH